MTEYSKTHPFIARMKERYSLCGLGSEKDTQHIILDLKDSGMTYSVGDSIAVFPHNDPQTVRKTLHAMNAIGEEVVLDKHGEEAYQLEEFLKFKANITEVNRKLVSEICFRQTNPEKKDFLEKLQSEDHKDAFKDYLVNRYVWDLLQENPEVSFVPQELCNLLMPMLPRFYSIASSNRVVGDEVHLTVALLRYHTNGYQRLGVCTHYLCNLAPLYEPVIPIYIQPHHGFTLPEDSNASIIMIGPGTGVAPFRAFMQERMAKNCLGKNWLFFGERNEKTDFFYKDYWLELVDRGKLRLNVAFSRDQNYKIYVQDRMKEQGADLFQWLEEGSYLYVCGDAQYMAKDVEAALLQIIQKHGKKDEIEAKQYLKALRAHKRYLRDVY